ncbi:hypothetical protein DEA8626_00081 [Defluviimonas aquaemixtae]|uniref:Uncharacterized protein n=1 Tax=Albidovulum aquaemixtae TaxID=1542388 RepID=A0A2R8B1Q6_9RHOB|nr:hypothetical protein [Defluviimonas aquaemixtae]SPH16571.1 hypothetical protein DEA8626_00081 [Defluviimonas aquaemixtae]
MRESLSIAVMFLLLAIAGIEPGHAQGAKTCKAGIVADVLSLAC